MGELIQESINWFDRYCDSFGNLTTSQAINFEIKKEHSKRVAGMAKYLAEKMNWKIEDQQIAYLVGLFHDIGRFRQLVEYDTFNDVKSVDHAELGLEVLKSEGIEALVGEDVFKIIIPAVQNHNKLQITGVLSDNEMLHARLIRDADKLDILRVLSEYYNKHNTTVNHTLTWELPKGSVVSNEVAKEAMAGKLVSKKNVLSEVDVKIMQLTWAYDINFKSSFEMLSSSRYMESIYNTLPKSDQVIGIYRMIKVFIENRIFNENKIRVQSIVLE